MGPGGAAQAATAHNPAPHPAGAGVQRSAVSPTSPVAQGGPGGSHPGCSGQGRGRGSSTTTQLLPATGSAAAAGALSPSGCTTSGTDVACDLWSMPGTTSILGRSIPIWGFS